MKVYQTYSMREMALTDQWFPTKKDAVEHVRSAYGVTGKPDRDERNGDLLWESDEDGTIIISEHVIELTKYEICQALTNLPNR